MPLPLAVGYFANGDGNIGNCSGFYSGEWAEHSKPEPSEITFGDYPGQG